MMRSLFAVALACAAPLLWACSDDDPADPQPLAPTGDAGAGNTGAGGEGGTGGQGGEAGCAILDLSLTQVYRYTDAHFSVQADATPGADGAYRTRAVIELYNDWVSPELPPLEAGTFDLAAAPNDAYGTCQHCVTVITPDASEIPTRTFFQTGGSIELTYLDEFNRTVAAGTVTDVTLSEVAQNEEGAWGPVTDGACFVIPSWSFDTTPVDGIPCEKAEDCGNTTLQVCSPDTSTCAPYECLFTFDVLCPEGEMCFSQVPGEISIGACYEACSPAASGECPSGSECVAIDPVQNVGLCRSVGDGSAGDACSEPDISTGCEAGHLCSGVPATCAATCSYLTADPGCPAGLVCNLSNHCVPPDNGAAAAIDQACQASWVPYLGCGADDEAFRGLCMSLYPEETVEHCERICRMTGDDGCPSGEYCAGIFSNTDVGICWGIPVCGDGELDPLNEICDDGNTDSGDGCASDCDAAEFDVLCEAAEPLALDVEIEGTTVGAPTGYGGSCELYVVVPSKTYSFDVPGPGRLSIDLTSDENLDLLVVGDCADPNGSEIACQSQSDAGESLDLDFATAPSGPLLIVVRGNTIPAVGPFTLDATFTPAVCGDGIAVGPEVCDDGNTVLGDGFCAADCLSPDWPEICVSMPTLSTTSANTGDTAAAPNVNNSDFYCTFGTGGEVMYRYVAPDAGTLELHLEETVDNFAVYVLDGCGAATEGSLLSCGNNGFPPLSEENLSVPLAAGQAVTVVVDSWAQPGPGGPFSLEATFQ